VSPQFLGLKDEADGIDAYRELRTGHDAIVAASKDVTSLPQRK
jgi:hypothetical protein